MNTGIDKYCSMGVTSWRLEALTSIVKVVDMESFHFVDGCF